MFNDAVRPAFEAGWLKPNGVAGESQYASDGDFDAEWKSQAEIIATLNAERDEARARAEKAEMDEAELLTICQMQISKARADALKEAAQIAESQPFYPDTHTGLRQAWVRGQIASRIRALSHPTPEKGE